MLRGWLPTAARRKIRRSTPRFWRSSTTSSATFVRHRDGAVGLDRSAGRRRCGCSTASTIRQKLTEITQVRRLGDLRPADRHQVPRRHVAAQGRLPQHREAVGAEGDAGPDAARRHARRRSAAGPEPRSQQRQAARPAAGPRRDQGPRHRSDGCRQTRGDQEGQRPRPRSPSTSSTTSSPRACSTRRSAAALVDIPLFPFMCIKGPVVRITPQVTWEQGKAQVVNKPKMFWNRVSPFDVWWTPGVSNIADAAVDRAHPGDALGSQPADRAARLQPGLRSWKC